MEHRSWFAMVSTALLLAVAGAAAAEGAAEEDVVTDDTTSATDATVAVDAALDVAAGADGQEEDASDADAADEAVSAELWSKHALQRKIRALVQEYRELWWAYVKELKVDFHEDKALIHQRLRAAVADIKAAHEEELAAIKARCGEDAGDALVAAQDGTVAVDHPGSTDEESCRKAIRELNKATHAKLRHVRAAAWDELKDHIHDYRHKAEAKLHELLTELRRAIWELILEYRAHAFDELERDALRHLDANRPHPRDRPGDGPVKDCLERIRLARAAEADGQVRGDLDAAQAKARALALARLHCQPTPCNDTPGAAQACLPPDRCPTLARAGVRGDGAAVSTAGGNALSVRCPYPGPNDDARPVPLPRPLPCVVKVVHGDAHDSNDAIRTDAANGAATDVRADGRPVRICVHPLPPQETPAPATDAQPGTSDGAEVDPATGSGADANADTDVDANADGSVDTSADGTTDPASDGS